MSVMHLFDFVEGSTSLWCVLYEENGCGAFVKMQLIDSQLNMTLYSMNRIRSEDNKNSRISANLKFFETILFIMHA